MKTWIKTSIAAALLATSAIGATAMARGGDCDAMGDGRSAWHEKSPEKMKARMMQRAEVQSAKLELALALTPEQKPAWEDFKLALKARGERMLTHMASKGAAERPVTVLDRMQQMDEMSKLRQAEMAEMRKSVELFYGKLSAAQKTVFDAEFEKMGPRHGRDGGEKGERRSKRDSGGDEKGRG